MAATPQYGTLIFRGAVTGKTYLKDAYISDVNGALVNLDGGSGASSTSPTDTQFPEPVILTDWSVVTGLVDTSKMQPQRDSIPTGDMIRHAIHLTTIATRPRLQIGWGVRQKVSFTQRT